MFRFVTPLTVAITSFDSYKRLNLGEKSWYILRFSS